MSDTDNQYIDIVCGKAGANIPFLVSKYCKITFVKLYLRQLFKFSVDVDETFSFCYQIYVHRKHNVELMTGTIFELKGVFLHTKNREYKMDFAMLILILKKNLRSLYLTFNERITCRQIICVTPEYDPE
jgi:hypothetical protein